MIDELTRPIVGIENRTAQEVFDIMAARIRRSALSPSSTGETEGWRDIESAPKDGTPVLLTAFGGQLGVCVWIRGWLYHGLPATPADWWDEPSHWRPLPAPPSAMLSAAGERG